MKRLNRIAHDMSGALAGVAIGYGIIGAVALAFAVLAKVVQ